MLCLLIDNKCVRLLQKISRQTTTSRHAISFLKMLIRCKFERHIHCMADDNIWHVQVTAQDPLMFEVLLSWGPRGRAITDPLLLLSWGWENEFSGWMENSGSKYGSVHAIYYSEHKSLAGSGHWIRPKSHLVHHPHLLLPVCPSSGMFADCSPPIQTPSPVSSLSFPYHLESVLAKVGQPKLTLSQAPWWCSEFVAHLCAALRVAQKCFKALYQHSWRK